MFNDIESLISKDKKMLRRGRPKHQKFPKKIIVYLDDEMFNNIKEQSEHQEISTSSYIRKILKEHI